MWLGRNIRGCLRFTSVLRDARPRLRVRSGSRSSQGACSPELARRVNLTRSNRAATSDASVPEFHGLFSETRIAVANCECRDARCRARSGLSRRNGWPTAMQRKWSPGKPEARGRGQPLPVGRAPNSLVTGHWQRETGCPNPCPIFVQVTSPLPFGFSPLCRGHALGLCRFGLGRVGGIMR